MVAVEQRMLRMARNGAVMDKGSPIASGMADEENTDPPWNQPWISNRYSSYWEGNTLRAMK